eukprot:scaffold2058_cov115-Isochrysis_galbana.AAC.19
MVGGVSANGPRGLPPSARARVGSRRSPKGRRRYAPRLSYLSRYVNLRRRSSPSKTQRCIPWQQI